MSRLRRRAPSFLSILAAAWLLAALIIRAPHSHGGFRSTQQTHALIPEPTTLVSQEAISRLVAADPFNPHRGQPSSPASIPPTTELPSTQPPPAVSAVTYRLLGTMIAEPRSMALIARNDQPPNVVWDNTELEGFTVSVRKNTVVLSSADTTIHLRVPGSTGVSNDQ